MLKDSICGFPLVFLDTVHSTNTYIKENYNLLPDKTFVIADMQTCGRGRLGNIWQGDRGMLAMSVLFKKPVNPVQLTFISAIAVLNALETLTGLPVFIKWTNDIICENRKVCGILCESTVKGSADGNTFSYAVSGMGVNVNQDPSFFESNGLPDAASLYMLTGKQYDKLTVAELVSKKLIELSDCEFDEIMHSYRSRCITVGKQVKLLHNNKEIYAYARSVGDDGCLICENTEFGEFRVNSGEVRLRLADGRYV